MTPEEFTRIRKNHWRRQSDAARALGYSRNKTISEFENGGTIPTYIERLMKYIDKYGYDPQILDTDEAH